MAVRGARAPGGRRLVAAGAAGALLALAFPPFDLWPAVFPAVAALSLLVRGAGARAGAAIGLVFGLAFCGLLLRWMSAVGIGALIGLVLLEAAFFAPLGMALARASRSRWWPLWHALLWVAVEAARARFPLGGMPWGRLAFSQADSPLAPLAALGGSPLVSFAAAGAATALAAALLAARARAVRPFALSAAAGVTVLAAGAAVPLPTGGDSETTVAIVQGDVPRIGLTVRAQKQAVFNNHVDATRQLADAIRAGSVPRPDMVIWPENGSDRDPYEHRPTRSRIDAMVADLGVPVLIGAVLNAGPEHVRNSGIVWTPGEGPGARYTKRHPVPFGEYVPMRDLLTRFIPQLERVPRDFLAGRQVGLLDLGGTRVGTVICFEVAYDDLVRDAVRAGGTLLVVQTNNATYGRTGQPEQQLAISRLRTIEHGRAMVIAATSGISGVIAPDGTIVHRTAEFTREVIVERVPVRTSSTLATKVGGWPELVLTLAGVVPIVTCRRRRTCDPRPPKAATVIEPATVPAGRLTVTRDSEGS